MLSSPAEILVLAQEPGQELDPEEVRRAAEEILSRGEFQEPEPTLVDRVEDWLGDVFGRLFEGAASGPGAAISWLIVLAIVGGVIWLVVRYAGPVTVARPAAGPALEYGTESHRPASEWLAEAAELAAAGNYRGALRCRHQAVIAAWITDGRIEHVPGRTASECHRAALRSGADPVTERLSRSIVDRFAHAWYGGGSVDAADYRRFAEDCDSLEAAVARQPETRPLEPIS